ncbi:MAG TPA: malto-oligosyltrehalose trehalohydrolase [Candidatus Acidoferrum sp.]|nr:malto-oligosyltrehalose trehalohydrolase [Candidatus Acidoferrum sp.]
MADRKLPVGAELKAQGVSFRVWAPAAPSVDVILESGPGSPAALALDPEGDGYFSAVVAGAGAGTRYRFRLGGAERGLPDPASRFQPEGPHGPSEVVDAAAFEWSDESWGGVALAGQVLYEMHVGTFSREGTWAGAAGELAELARLGVTAIELMPVAEFAGRFGWGYDGVDLFAPTRLYGRPDDFRRFVDRAHALGIGVVLDVVYNHLGPDGNHLRTFTPAYFTDRYDNEWGDAINFDGPDSGPVREFVTANAGYWIDEFHLDGLRLDATQQMFDTSPEHVITAIARRVREAGGRRSTLVIAENEPQQTRLLRPPAQGGHGLDAMWTDDFHHAARVAVTGRREAYYSDYRGTAQELVSVVKRGYLYQGQRSAWQGKRRGSPTVGIEPARFVAYLQNHDQVANSARGERLHALTSPGRFRASTALLLLAPLTPMLFQGQEFGASTPFLFFADHTPELARSVRRGRAEFLHQFPSIATPEIHGRLADPSSPETFEASRLDVSEREAHAEIYALHTDLLRMRRDDPVFSRQGAHGIDGGVLGADAFVLRLFGADGDDRLLVVNLGDELTLSPAPEPLLAPPEGRRWEIAWTSEHPRYGGSGWAPLDDQEQWRLAAHAACVARPVDETTHDG